MHSTSRIFAAFASGLLLLTAAACDSGDEENELPLSGRYEATTLVGVSSSGEQEDALAEGGSLTLRLEETGEEDFPPDVESFGEASSNFVVPASLSESGRRLTYELSGTYTLESDGRLAFDFEQAEDTFVGDIDWTYEGDGVIRDDADSFTVVLERQ